LVVVVVDRGWLRRSGWGLAGLLLLLLGHGYAAQVCFVSGLSLGKYRWPIRVRLLEYVRGGRRM
jgi:hypothetical protein